MCGLVGFVDSRASEAEGLQTVARMSSAIAHRGPDDAAQWCDPSAGLFFGFRRLAILDLSTDGRQPMHSASGRYTVVFNGEIYNFQELRAELASGGAVFRGGSDTEVLLAGVERYGVQQYLPRLTGMYAFALWDREEKALYLVRDRVGEKPLYYGFNNGVLFFGSELKSFSGHPSWSPEVDRDALTLYLRLKYIPAPYSVYRGIRKLEAGCCLKVTHDNGFALSPPQPYWSVQAAAKQGLQNRFAGGDDEALETLDSLLKTVVRRQMIADVPLGAFLSGGIDSSLIVAVMQSLSTRPIKTFSIGFGEREFNEAVFAKEVAQHLGSDHTELYLDAGQVLQLMPEMPAIWDEPFSDSSQVPTFLVAKLAREAVTVSLSGDGGDELFAGYKRYAKAERLLRRFSRMPRPLRAPLSSMLLPTADAAARFDRRASFRLRLAAQLFAARSPEEFYYSLISDWRDPSEIVIGSSEPPLFGPAVELRGGSFLEWMQLFDQRYYLPDDIMVKVDRASMAVSLESRAPFLDHQLIEFSWTLAEHFKVRQNRSKWILKELLQRYVPPALYERPKRGFAMPLGTWLRGPLRDWAEDLLAEKSISAGGFFDQRAVKVAWGEHLAGVRDLSAQLWSILSFEAWLRQQNGRPQA